MKVLRVQFFDFQGVELHDHTISIEELERHTLALRPWIEMNRKPLFVEIRFSLLETEGVKSDEGSSTPA